MNDSKYERIKIERAGRIMTLTLSNPAEDERGRMHRLADIFYDIQEDDSVDVVVLTGEGKAFCAGGDIEWIASRGQGEGPSIIEGRKIVFGLLDLEKPIIAKVRGPAIGLGCTIARAIFAPTPPASQTRTRSALSQATAAPSPAQLVGWYRLVRAPGAPAR